MQDVQFVQAFETSDDLDDHLPDVLLLIVLLVVLVFADALEDVAIISVLHHDA